MWELEKLIKDDWQNNYDGLFSDYLGLGEKPYKQIQDLLDNIEPIERMVDINFEKKCSHRSHIKRKIAKLNSS